MKSNSAMGLSARAKAPLIFAFSAICVFASLTFWRVDPVPTEPKGNALPQVATSAWIPDKAYSEERDICAHLSPFAVTSLKCSAGSNTTQNTPITSESNQPPHVDEEETQVFKEQRFTMLAFETAGKPGVDVKPQSLTGILEIDLECRLGYGWAGQSKNICQNTGALAAQSINDLDNEIGSGNVDAMVSKAQIIFFEDYLLTEAGRPVSGRGAEAMKLIRAAAAMGDETAKEILSARSR